MAKIFRATEDPSGDVIYVNADHVIVFFEETDADGTSTKIKLSDGSSLNVRETVAHVQNLCS
jgi:hypothetical protein